MHDFLILPAGQEEPPLPLSAILDIHRQAFGAEEEAKLTADLLASPPAAPVISLCAYLPSGPPSAETLAGHILFTRVKVEGHEDVPALILAPLAVRPGLQKSGVGTALCRAGLEQAGRDGVELVFVLGHPEYYPRFGFTPAAALGFFAPYDLESGQEPAWMVVVPRQDIPGGRTLPDTHIGGRVICAPPLMRPELWRE